MFAVVEWSQCQSHGLHEAGCSTATEGEGPANARIYSTLGHLG
jgi:hypothetical protein